MALRSLRRRLGRKVGFWDFSFLLLYMTVLAESGFSYSNMVKLLRGFKSWGGTFSKVTTAVDSMGYELAKALKYVSRTVKSPLNDFLMRLSRAIEIGLEPRDFMRIEYRHYMSSLMDEVERRINRLKLLSDAYSGIMSSAIFGTIALVFLSSISGLDATFVPVATALLVMAPALALVALMYTTLPPWNIAETMFERYSIYIAAATVAALALAISVDGNRPLMVMAASAPILSLSIITSRRLKYVERLSGDMPLFVRGLLDILSVVGSFEKALDVMRLHDYGSFNRLIARSRSLLHSGFLSERVFGYISKDTGNLIVRYFMDVIGSAITNGASPKALAEYVLSHMDQIDFARKRRSQVAGYLVGILVPLTLIAAAVFSLVDSLLRALWSMSTTLPLASQLLSPPPPTLVETANMAILMGMSIVNGFAIYVAKGDNMMTMPYYTSLMAMASAAIYLAVSMFSGNILSVIEIEVPAT